MQFAVMAENMQSGHTTFRQWVDLKNPKFANLSKDTAITHTDRLYNNVPLVRKINDRWGDLWNEPFRGVTTNGNPLFGRLAFPFRLR